VIPNNLNNNFFYFLVKTILDTLHGTEQQLKRFSANRDIMQLG